jgi:maltose alpha-D-glucosyltransferase / alpha-amylase
MLENDPQWYRDAIIYELHVRAFNDSVGDGFGDFRGLTAKLDYLEDLGVTAIWILPFYPSPLRDDGYDIADYTGINPSYGQLRDFQEFLNAAHKRNLRVITELVLNHTSDQHPWFQRARRAAPGTPERDFYVWSDTPDKYAEARIIFQDFEPSNWSWDPIAKAYYWHRFYSHQPDLNFDNPAVWQAMMPTLDFWLGMGVDGMRLDAVPYLFEREGTSCENLPETHGFLKALRQHMDERFPGRMLLAEANQWPEDAAAYFGEGDECHMSFHFPLMPRLFMAIHMEERFPIIDILGQTPAIPETCQWCIFLRNHDELTLEMVTDEERDYMYGAYASDPKARINLGIRRRLAPLLGNNRRRIELMNGLLFSLPGTPVLYYGDEIGMGDNIYLGDRNGVRTPMQWSADRNAGFSRANPQKLYLPTIIDPEYHYEAINVEAQQNNSNSLLWWMKRLIATRRRHQAFGRGTVEPLQPANRAVLAFLRRYNDECLLIVANLSRFVQHVELDLSRMHGQVPVEMFGGNAFPRIGKQPYSLTLGPHAFYWFAIEERVEKTASIGPEGFDTIVWPSSETNLFNEQVAEQLAGPIGSFLHRTRPGQDRAWRRRFATVLELQSLPSDGQLTGLCLAEAEFDTRAPQNFLIPLAFATGAEAEAILQNDPNSIIAKVSGSQSGLLYDGLKSPALRRSLVTAVLNNETLTWPRGQLAGRSLLATEQRAAIDLDVCKFATRSDEQTNTSLQCAESLILKIFRRIESGPHPEIEIGRFLGDEGSFKYAAPVIGLLEYQPTRQEPIALAVMHNFVPHEATAWQYTLDEVSRYCERVLALPADVQPPKCEGLLQADSGSPTDATLAKDLLGRYLDSAKLLGRRTAQLHKALASDNDRKAFAPEPLTQMTQRSIYQSMRNVQRRALDALDSNSSALPPDQLALAQEIMQASDKILGRFQPLLVTRFGGQRTRCHGDYNLWEVLFTGKDFVIIDFEGDPRKSLGDRRIKRHPLRDVATMIRSLDYAISSAFITGGGGFRGRTPGVIRPEDMARLAPWAVFWRASASRAFLASYLENTQGAAFLPTDPLQTNQLLEIFLLERGLQELTYELHYRQAWANIPLRDVAHRLQN